MMRAAIMAPKIGRGAFHILYHNRDGFVLFQIQGQVGQQEVVPDPHGLQDAHGDVGGLHDGKNHREEGTDG